MLKLTYKGILSTGAVPKTGDNQKKLPKNQHKDCETEVGTSAVQSGSENFPYELSLGDQAAGLELETDKPNSKKRHKSVNFALEGASSSKKAKYDPAAGKHECRVFQNGCMIKRKRNEGTEYTSNQIDNEIASTSSASTPPAPKKSRLIAAADIDQDVNMDSPHGTKEKGEDDPHTESNNLVVRHKKPKNSKCFACAMSGAHHAAVFNNISKDILEDQLTAEFQSMHIESNVPLPEKTVPAHPKHEQNLPNTIETDANCNNTNEFVLPQLVKWTKKRLYENTEEVSTASNQHTSTSVVVQNLPMAMIAIYHQKLAEVFGKHGHITHIGAAERSSETGGDVFNTTIYFETEEAATKAIEEPCFHGSGIHISRPIAATEAAVVHSYSLLPTAELREIFENARLIRRVHDGKRCSSRKAVAFLEFDGPEAAERAGTLSGTIQVNGKQVYVHKFEVRDKNRKPGKQQRFMANSLNSFTFQSFIDDLYFELFTLPTFQGVSKL